MIKNFNFYDVYGFFFPGIIFVTLIWLPFGLITNQWPEEKVASALIAIVFGYIIGHILQTLGPTFFPSTMRDAQGHRRYPSSVFLDSDNSTFSTVFKGRLSEYIRASFNADVNIGASAQGISTLGTRVNELRREVFLLCRSILVKSKVASYAEQFEGLYAMMRGLAVAFLLGSVYNAGWYSIGLLHAVIQQRLWYVLLGGFTVAILASLFSISRLSRSQNRLIRWMKRWNGAWVVVPLCLSLFAVGNHLGQGKVISDDQRNLLLVIILGSLFSLFRCYGAFKEHTKNFVKAVYNDFYVYSLAGEKGNVELSREKPDNGEAESDGDTEDD